MGLLDALIYGVRKVVDADGVEQPTRSRIKFTGPVSDDQANDWTLVDTGAGAGVPGTDTQAIFNDAGALAGTNALRFGPNGAVFTGKPSFNVDYNEFIPQGDIGVSVARSYSIGGQTTDDTPTPVVAIILPASIDCRVTVIGEFEMAYAAGGGPRSCRASFKRISGTLSIVGTVSDESDVDKWEGTAIGGLDIAASAGTIAVSITGIAATPINVLGSLHVLITEVPA